MNRIQQSGKIAAHPLSILVTLGKQCVDDLLGSLVEFGVETDRLEDETGQSPTPQLTSRDERLI